MGLGKDRCFLGASPLLYVKSLGASLQRSPPAIGIGEASPGGQAAPGTAHGERLHHLLPDARGAWAGPRGVGPGRSIGPA